MNLEEESLRSAMVEGQIKARGIKNERVLQAFMDVPRHLFVPESKRIYAYEDTPLPIGEGQTISQPYIVSLMTEAAQISPQDKILEIGSGSGYQAAILSRLAKEVYTVERIASLSEQAKKVCDALGYTNIHFKVDDGTLGWPEFSPYQAILVTASAPHLPKALLEQLAIGGRLIIPVGDSFTQNLLRMTKVSETEVQEEILEFVRFVPLIGEDGWKQSQ